jgi:hypothetical protein
MIIRAIAKGNNLIRFTSPMPGSDSISLRCSIDVNQDLDRDAELGLMPVSAGTQILSPSEIRAARFNLAVLAFSYKRQRLLLPHHHGFVEGYKHLIHHFSDSSTINGMRRRWQNLDRITCGRRIT